MKGANHNVMNTLDALKKDYNDEIVEDEDNSKLDRKRP